MSRAARAHWIWNAGRAAAASLLALGVWHCQAEGARTAYPGEPMYAIGGGPPVSYQADAGAGLNGHTDGGSTTGSMGGVSSMCPQGISLWEHSGLIPDAGPTNFPACTRGDLLIPGVSWPLIAGDPLSVAVGDFNGDGTPDLAVAVMINEVGMNHGDVTILLGNGDGTYTTGGSFPVGSTPQAIVAADLNGDKVLDVVVSNAAVSSTVSVLLGQGDGTLQPAVDYAVGASAAGLTIGDFDGDKVPDLAVANSASNDVRVLLNHGDGTFGAAAIYPVQTAPQDVVTADFNGDGNLDLAVANQYASPGSDMGSVSILLGNGHGGFQHLGDYSAGENPWNLAVADFNGDGIPDVVVTADGSSYVDLLFGQSNGSLSAPTTFSTGAEPWGVTIGDFNGDGRPDIAVANSGQFTVSVLLGNGHGFGAALSFGVGAAPTTIVTADVDGDGHLDLVVPNGGGDTVAVILGIGTGTFRIGTAFGGETGPQELTAADLDGDGKPDLAVANNQSNTVSVLLHDECGFLFTDHITVGNAPWGIVSADLNADGRPDLAVTNNGSATVSLLLNEGKSSFNKSTLDVGADPRGLVAADLNGDGTLDLAVASGDGVSVLIGTGGGMFGASTNFPAGSEPSGIAVGDFNGDGHPDLIVTDSDTGSSSQYGLSLLLGNGDGTFGGPKSFNAGEDLTGITVGDFNGDGKLDVAVVSQQELQTQLEFGTAVVLLGNGDGTFGTAQPYAVGYFPNEIVAADFNRDGALDLAVSNSDGVDVLVGKGDGTFTAAVDYGAGPASNGFTDYCSSTTCAIRGPSGITTSDFNADGFPDLAVSVYDGNNVNVILNAACSH